MIAQDALDHRPRKRPVVFCSTQGRTAAANAGGLLSAPFSINKLAATDRCWTTIGETNEHISDLCRHSVSTTDAYGYSKAAHSEPLNKGSVTMLVLSVSNRSTGFSTVLAACAALFILLSPAAASDQNSPSVLTSHSPWLAPVGHRQPTRADAPENALLSAWEREQARLDAELDRKLVICRGC